MKRLSYVGLAVLKAVNRVGYVLLAAVALLPLSPVIGLMYFAKWIHVDDAGEEFITIYGQGDKPVR